MTEKTILLKIEEAQKYITGMIPSITDKNALPKLGMILGSGLGGLANFMQKATVIPYANIPHFPHSTVAGHAGELIIGQVNGMQAVLLNGRFHLYEGYHAETVALPIQVMKALGVEVLIVTNAAGAVNDSYHVGSIMLIRDHINLTNRNPLIGRNVDQIGVRFPDLSDAYSNRLMHLARKAALQLHLTMPEGVYAGLKGPSYETPAEIRMLRTLGADAVGMSTVSEVIAARHAGIEVLGFSCIANMAAGILDVPLSHEDVITATEQVKQHVLHLVLEVISLLAKELK